MLFLLNYETDSIDKNLDNYMNVISSNTHLFRGLFNEFTKLFNNINNEQKAPETEILSQ
jgi:hypothetical protein